MVSPDGKWVAYTIPAFDDDANLYSEIFLKSTDETPPRSLGKVAGELDQVTWIGNDQIALSQFAMANQFAVLETTGKRLPDIVLPPKCNVIYMTLSPDAQNVAFTGWRNVGDKNEYGLFVWRLRQNEVRLLIEKELKTRPAWSPDSRRLAIGAARGYTKDYPLQVVDITTGNVDDTGVLGVGASWSPDGKLIACTTGVRRGGSWIRGIPTDGKLGIYDVEKRTMQILEGTDGAIDAGVVRDGKLCGLSLGRKHLDLAPERREARQGAAIQRRIRSGPVSMGRRQCVVLSHQDLPRTRRGPKHRAGENRRMGFTPRAGAQARRFQAGGAATGDREVCAL